MSEMACELPARDRDQARPAGGRGSGVLDDCPPLERLLEVLAAIDRLQSEAVDLVSRLQRTGEAEAATGVPLELWLAAEGRRTRSDRRMLGTAADTLTRLPALRDAFARGLVSWAQVRAITLACERLPAHLCRAVDEALGPELVALADAEPDALIHLLRQALGSLDPATTGQPEPAEPETRFLHVQPTLDDGGGRIYGQLDAIGLAVLTEATDPGPPDEPSRTSIGDPGDPEQRRSNARSLARRRADRLIEVLAASLADAPAGATATPGDGASLPVAANLSLVMSLDALLGRDHTPAELVTSLTGGRLMVSTATARRLLDTGGANVRTIVLDETGRALGVGRKHRRAIGWVREVLDATEATCAAPCCDTAARLCHGDHLHPWHVGGRTDLDNLQPLCAPHNRHKEHGWRVEALPDGSRRWTHARSGLAVRTIRTGRTLRLSTPDPPGGTDPPAV